MARIPSSPSSRAPVRQRGFTLAEVLVATIVIGLLVAAVLPLFTQNVQYMQHVDTRARLDRLRAALELVYRQQAWTIDSRADAVLATGTQAIQPGALVAAQWADVVRIAGLSPELLLDGHNRPWQVQVSQRLTRQRGGINVPYHVIALASNDGGDYDGAAQTLDPGTTFDPATGAVTFAGRDVGIVVDGFRAWDTLVGDADRQVRAIADAYSTWYRARARQSGGSLTANYFASRGANPAWDATAVVPQILADCDLVAPDGFWGVPLWQAQLDQVLGLGASATAPWGQALRVQNCAAPVRSPANGAGQPYSAVLAALLPDGTRIEAVATGVPQ